MESHYQSMTARLARTGLIALICGATFGQAAGPPGKFEIADVHVSPRSTHSFANRLSGGLVRGGQCVLRHATMLDLVRVAWGVDGAKVLGGPSWLELDRFDVRAGVPAGATAATVRPMLQALLQDRFALVARNDTRPVPAFALTAGKHPQLKQSDGVGDASCKVDRQTGAGSGATQGPGAPAPAVATVAIACHNMSMAAFAEGMNNMEGAGKFINNNMVIDQTGLQGAWDFRLKYSGRITTAGAEIVTIFDAVDKQLGLKLEPSEVPMPVVVVDSVNRTPTPNSVEAAKAFPPPPTEFEVAAVKPSDPGTRGVSVRLEPGGRFSIRAATLRLLVAYIWGVTGDMLVGAPRFMDSQGWYIVAKAPEAEVDPKAEQGADYDVLLQMAKTLIQDRFKFVFHYEERPVSAYVLTSPKPKMKKADPNSRTSCKEGPPELVTNDPRNFNPAAGRLLSCRNTTMAYLADQLQWLADGYVHTAVLDSTGLEGGWDFTLNFSSAGPPGVPPSGSNEASDPNGPISLPLAMEKQLGLKLELVKRPVQVLVIDHIEQKPTDN